MKKIKLTRPQLDKMLQEATNNKIDLYKIKIEQLRLDIKSAKSKLSLERDKTIFKGIELYTG